MTPEEIETEISRLEHLEVLRERQRIATEKAESAAKEKETRTLDFLVTKYPERAERVLINYYALHPK